MLQSLLSLEDNDIDIVLAAVTAYCNRCGVDVESQEGRRAISKAVELACARGPNGLIEEMSVHLDS